ncbi:hypothetical protein [Nonomuraea sp. NPDC049480]|uniref:hypothetical protein n=1 Tax=Nonomuraea sp. NPDC049480 TaxID=3364353 RepID=UPI0037B4D49E
MATMLQEIFQRGLLRVYANGDVTVCALGGALKNVVATAAGVAEKAGRGGQHQGRCHHP